MKRSERNLLQGLQSRLPTAWGPLDERAAPSRYRGATRMESAVELIGMLDSPYVRRVAVAMLTAEVPFVHRPISLFRHIDEFSKINPLLKAPTLVADDGTVLTDSGVILDYLGCVFPKIAALSPSAPALRLRAARAIGLALTAMEKAVQLHYERALRPPEKQHEPWRARVAGQLDAALAALDREAPDFRLDRRRRISASPTSPSPAPSASSAAWSATSSRRRFRPARRRLRRAPRRCPPSARRRPRTASSRRSRSRD